MDLNKSLDEYEVIAALLHDVHRTRGLVFNTRALRLTLSKIKRRSSSEGLSFLTKTLPRLGKAFDRAMSASSKLNAASLGFKPQLDSELPRFLGEFFNRVLAPDGGLLPNPCNDSVAVIRQVLYLFYKYELPYSDEQEQQVISSFIKTESDLSSITEQIKLIEAAVLTDYGTNRRRIPTHPLAPTARIARKLLEKLFRDFDPQNISPRHGPGAVATRQQLSDKFRWTNVSGRITEVYPFDAYFCASLGHVCDRFSGFDQITDRDLPARVVLVPKDSRGPRLISCEPVDFQWIQQGLSRAIVRLVESHPLTKWNVNFTDQSPNQRGAHLGSKYGGYATLDLKEASDRVSVDLVRLLFPENLYRYLSACRSLSTELPTGEVLTLKKYAPMGSALCFPVLALTVWAILAAGTSDADTKERILVYGDDVIVPTAYAENAIKLLESFGLLVNRDKSCTKGLFRESCGTDSFQGVNVTPVRLRTVWASSPSPDVYTSWIAYANSFYDKQFYRTYDLIVSRLTAIYGWIPGRARNLSCPNLREESADGPKFSRRYNKKLQKLQYRVYDVTSPEVSQTIDGWSMLLRYFTEASPINQQSLQRGRLEDLGPIEVTSPFSVSSYTKRRTSILVRRWR